MNTVFLLMAQYDGRAVIPADVICRDFFAPLTFTVFMRKIGNGISPCPWSAWRTARRARAWCIWQTLPITLIRGARLQRRNFGQCCADSIPANPALPRSLPETKKPRTWRGFLDLKALKSLVPPSGFEPETP